MSELQEKLVIIHSSDFLTQLDMELFTSHKSPTSKMNENVVALSWRRSSELLPVPTGPLEHTLKTMDLIKQLISHLQTETINRLNDFPKSHSELAVKLERRLQSPSS